MSQWDCLESNLSELSQLSRIDTVLEGTLGDEDTSGLYVVAKTSYEAGRDASGVPDSVGMTVRENGKLLVTFKAHLGQASVKYAFNDPFRLRDLAQNGSLLGTPLLNPEWFLEPLTAETGLEPSFGKLLGLTGMLIDYSGHIDRAEAGRTLADGIIDFVDREHTLTTVNRKLNIGFGAADANLEYARTIETFDKDAPDISEAPSGLEYYGQDKEQTPTDLYHDAEPILDETRIVFHDETSGFYFNVCKLNPEIYEELETDDGKTVPYPPMPPVVAMLSDYRKLVGRRSRADNDTKMQQLANHLDGTLFKPVRSHRLLRPRADKLTLMNAGVSAALAELKDNTD